MTEEREIPTSTDEEYFRKPKGGIELANIFAEYPTEKDPELAAKLYSYKEFKDLGEFIDLQEKQQKGPTERLFNHQEVIARWICPLTGQDRVIIISDPGMGKTPSGVIFCEQGNSRDRKALVITPSDKINDGFKKNIFKIVSNKYKVPPSELASLLETSAPISSSTSTQPQQQQQKKSRSRKVGSNPLTNVTVSDGIAGSNVTQKKIEFEQGTLPLSDYYTFETRDHFASIIAENFDPDTDALRPEFLAEYEGCSIIIDELHHIRGTRETQKTKKKKKEKNENLITDSALSRVLGGDDKIQWLKGVRNSYRAYLLFFHSLKKVRLCGLTATPAVDNIIEYFFTMNLLLPRDKLFISNKPTFNNFKKLDHEQLIREINERCSGMIAYARARYRAKRIDVGLTIGEQESETGEIVDYKSKYVPCVMSIDQYDVIRRIEKDEGVPQLDEVPEDIMEIEDIPERENAFMTNSRSASNIIFYYNNKWVSGNEPRVGAGGKRIKGKNKDPVFNYYFEGDAIKGWRFAEAPNDRARQAAIDFMKETVSKLDVDGGLPSVSPKYAEVIKYLQRNDKRVTYIYSTFVTGSGIAVLYAIILLYPEFEAYQGQSLNDLIEEKRKLGNRVGPKRIALLTSKLTKIQTKNLINIFNSKANKYGDLIYAVLGSPSSGESYSFFNVRRVIIASHPWNASLKKQVDGRSFRIEGAKAFDDPNERNVEVITLAAVAPPPYDKNVTPDVRVIMLAENKGKEITGPIRASKQCAFDGLVNKQLNQRPEERGYDYENDYSSSTYPIITGDITVDGEKIESKKVRTGNFDLYYDVDRTGPIQAITKYLRENTVVSLEQLIEDLTYERTSILFALDTLIHSRTKIQDGYGNYSYVVEKENLIFLQPEYRTPDPLYIHYSKYRYVSNPELPIVERLEAKEMVDNFYLTSIENPELTDDLFSDLYAIINHRISILYEGWIDGTYDFGEHPEVLNTILERLRTSGGFLELNEISEDKKKNVASSSKSTEKRQILLYHKLKIGHKVLKRESYARGTRLSAARKTKKRSEIRVYDGKTQEWRYANWDEDELIVDQENEMDRLVKIELSGNKVWGFKYLIDGKIYLLFPEGEKGRETKTKKGGRKRKTVEEQEETEEEEEEEEEEGEGKSKKEKGGADQRYKIRGKAVVSTNKSLIAYSLWHLAQITQPKRYYLDFKYDEEEAKRSREIWLGDLRPDPRSPKQNNQKYREDKDRPTLEEIGKNLEMLSFFRWFFTSEITAKTNNPNKRHLTTSYLIEERLKELGLLRDK